MPIESDNDAEREARIAEMVRKIRQTQERVEALAAEGRRRAAQSANERQQQNRASSPSTGQDGE